MGNDESKSIELKLVLSSTGAVDLKGTQKEIRLVVEAAEKAGGTLSGLSLALQRNLSGFEQHVTKLASALGLSFQRNLEQSLQGMRGFGREVQQTEQFMTAAVVKGNLLATALTRIADFGAGKLREAFSLGKNFVKGVTDEFGDQAKQIIRTSEAYERFQISIENAVRSQERARLVSKLAFGAGAASPFGVGDFERATSQLLRVPAIRAQAFGEEDAATKRLTTIYDTVTRLASLDPERGVPGAVFAFRLAMQGQFRALTRQYNISVGEVVEATGRSAKELKQNGALLAEGLSSVLKERVTDEAIARLGRLPSAKISNLKEYVETIIPRQIGQAGFREAVQDVLGSLDDAFLTFVEPGGAFERRFAPKLSDALTRILGGVVKGGSAALGVALDFAPGEDPLSAFFAALERFANKAADTVESVANTLASDRGQKLLTSVFDTLFTTMERFVDGIFSLVKRIPDLLPFFGQTLQVVSLVTQGIATIVERLGSFIDNFIDQLIDKVPGFKISDTGRAALENRESRAVNAGLRSQLQALDPAARFSVRGSSENVALGAADNLAAQLGDLFRGGGTQDAPISLARTGELRQLARQLLTSAQADLFQAAVEEARGSDGQVDPERFSARLNASRRLLGARFGQLAAQRFDGDPGAAGFQFSTQGTNPNFPFLVDRGSTDDPFRTLLGLGGVSPRAFAPINANRFASEFSGGGGVAELNKLAELAKRFSDPGTASGLGKSVDALRDLFATALAGPGGAAAKKRSRIAGAVDFTLQGFREAGGDLSSNASLAREQLETSFFSPTERAAQAGDRLDAQRAYVASLIEESYRSGLALVVKEVFAGGVANLPEAVKAIGQIGVGNKRSLKSLGENLSALNLAALSGGLGALLQIDPRDVDSLSAGTDEIERLAQSLSAITLDDGSRAFLGGGGVRKTVAGIFQAAGGEFKRETAGFGAFGGGTDAQIAQQQTLLRLFEQQDGYLGNMLDVVRNLNLTAEERVLLEQRVRFETEKQSVEIRRSLEVLERRKKIEREDRTFEDRLFNETAPGFEQETRLKLVQERLQATTRSYEGLKVFLEEAPFFGDEDKYGRLVSLLGEEEQRVRGLQVEYRGLKKSVDDAARARAQSDFLNKTGAGKIGSALDVFEFDERTGALKGTKSLEKLAEENGQQFGVSFVSGLQSGLGGSVKGLLTGDLDAASQAWQNFFDGLLTAFSDLIAKMALQAAFASIFGESTPNFLGSALSTVSGTGGALPGVGGSGSDVELGILGGGLRPNALGGIEGYSQGGRTSRPQIIRVGEGGTPEAVVPSPGGTIPLVMTADGPAARLPGGRLLPAQFIQGYADGGMAGGGYAASPGGRPSRLPPSAYRGDTYLNVVVLADPADITRRGLAANTDAVIAIGASDTRNQGKLYRAARRQG